MAYLVSSCTRALAAYPAYVAREIAEFRSTLTRYFDNPRFRRADLLCRLAYLMRNPDAICRDYLRRFRDDQVQRVYGETYFSTLDAIARAVKLTQHDVIYDLGCGRGRSVFWLNASYGCRAVGVDLNPTFVVQARLISKMAGLKGAEFIQANLMDVDYGEATVIYLYGTAFTDQAVEKIVRQLAGLKPGTRVVSVSYRLSTYSDEPLFEMERVLRCRYPWGDANVYIQRRL